jgi:hypothetical protein
MSTATTATFENQFEPSGGRFFHRVAKIFKTCSMYLYVLVRHFS